VKSEKVKAEPYSDKL